MGELGKQGMTVVDEVDGVVVPHQIHASTCHGGPGARRRVRGRGRRDIVEELGTENEKVMDAEAGGLRRAAVRCRVSRLTELATDWDSLVAGIRLQVARVREAALGCAPYL